MTDVSLVRLYVLRGAYLLVAASLGSDIWPLIVQHSPTTSHMTGVVWSILGTVSILCALGVRYPLQMLPIFFFEIVWKIIWLTAFALPLYLADKVSAAVAQTAFDCSVGVILLIAMPWSYVWERYVTGRGDRWVSKGG